MPRYVTADVTYDGETSSTYPARVDLDARLWNGWLSPLFDRETAERLVADQAFVSAGNVDADALRWNGDAVEIISAYDGSVESIDPIVVDGQPYWTIGAWAWTWTFATDEPDADTLAELGYDPGLRDRGEPWSWWDLIAAGQTAGHAFQANSHSTSSN